MVRTICLATSKQTQQQRLVETLAPKKLEWTRLERISQSSLLGVSIILIHPRNTMFDPSGFGNLNL